MRSLRENKAEGEGKEEQMIIKDAILHIMDFALDVCVFSEQQLDLSENGTGEFIEKHLSRLIDDSAAKEGNFSDYSIFKQTLKN